MRYILVCSWMACGGAKTAAELPRPDWAPELGPCTVSDLEVDVSSGTPVFRWEGAASDLIVGETVSVVEVNEDLSWAIQCDDEINWEEPEFGYISGVPDNCLTSGVTYGDPGAAYEFGPALDLVSGRTYEAAVVQWCDSEEAPDFIQLASATASFTVP